MSPRSAVVAWSSALALACSGAVAASASQEAAAPAPPAVPAAPAAPPTPAADPARAAAPAVVRSDLAGVWRGASPKEPPYHELRFERPADPSGAWTVAITIPPVMVLDRVVPDAVVEEGRRFRCSTQAFGLTFRMEGALEADGTRITGKGSVERNGATEEFELHLAPTAVASSVPGAASYSAELSAMGMKLPMALTLADAGELGMVGSIDIPAQSIERMPVVVERTEDGRLEVTLPVGVPALMTLAPEDEGKALRGTFAQGPVTAPIEFRRSEGPLKGSARPQNPVPPFPYLEREVEIPCEAGHTLAGTLTIPGFARKDRRVPGVVMLTGSGPQDRDESLMGHRPFLVIADALSRAGIAVLRCDDRGVGKSTGDPSSATSRDFAVDGRSMMAFLRTQPEIDPALCGYVGHSEGGLTGPLAALGDQEAGAPVAFVVLLAGPAVPGAEVLAVQVGRLLRAAGVPEESIAPLVERNRRITAALAADEPKERIRELLADTITEQQRMTAEKAGIVSPEPLTPESDEVAMVARQLESAWMREFIVYDPAPTLRQVKAPMLAMNGDLDTQVDAEQNLVRVEAIRREAGVPITVHRYPNLNHLFQPATTGGVDEYALIETTFDPGALEDLTKWIQETTTRAAASAAATGAGPVGSKPAGRIVEIKRNGAWQPAEGGGTPPPSSAPSTPSPSSPR